MNRINLQRNFWFLLFLHISLLTIILVGYFVLVGRVSAQATNQWSTPRQIPGYSADTKPPILIADQNRTVHAFNSTWIEGENLLVYSKWTKDTGWTAPTDVILPKLKQQIRLKGATLDSDGQVHILFFSGDELEAGIFYSNAPLAQADFAPAWSNPELIGLNAESFPEEAALVSDSEGNLIALYSANRPSMGLYAIYSSDGGNSWSEPDSVFQTYRTTHKPNSVKMYVDSNDNVHAVWGEANEAGNGVGVYYSHMKAGSTDWTEPVALSTETTAVNNDPSIVEFNDELFIFIHGNGSNGLLSRFMLRSVDSGESWSEAEQPFNYVGSNGPTSFVIDSNNRLHMFFGNRVTLASGNTVHGMWHTVWEGQEWSNPEAVVAAPRVVDEDGLRGFDPSFANAIISQGNTILVSWQTDPAAGLNGVWYSSSTIDTPELAGVALATPKPTSIANKSETDPSSLLQINESMAESTFPSGQESGTDGQPDAQRQRDPVISLFMGLVPVVLLILLIPLVYGLRQRI